MVEISFSASDRRYDWLDLSRFAAALGVVFFHYFYNGIDNGKVDSLTPFGAIGEASRYGFLGVPFFFMISGFVIMLTAEHHSPRSFAISRIVRLWPAFLFCMTLTTIVSVFFGGERFSVTLTQYFANLSMMPNLFGQDNIDGVYWTLEYEIRFYATVFLIICIFPQILRRVVLVWALLQAPLWFAGWSIEFFDNRYIYFASGGLLYLIHRDGFSLVKAVALAGVLVVSVSSILGSADGRSPIVLAGLTIAFHLFFIVFSTTKVGDMRIPFAYQIGSLTYPLYLLHAHIGYIAISGLGTEQNRWIVLTGTIVVMLLLSSFVAYYVEFRPRLLYRSMAGSCIDWLTRAWPTRLWLRPKTGTS